MKSRQNPFFARMEEGAKRAAERLNVDLDALATDKETDTEKQTSQVETVISKRVEVILMTPVDSKAIIAPLLEAQRQGIKIINIDNRIDVAEAAKAGLNIATFIGPDNVEGACKSAKAMIDKVGKEGGKIALIEGVRGADNAEQRKKGFELAVKQAQADGYKVEVAAMDTGEWMTEPAQRKMEGILNQHPDLKGVFCANDMMALGAIQAIKSAGKTGQIVVTAYDNLKAAQDAIKAGTLFATIEQHPDRMGELGVEYALKLLKGETLPPVVPVATDLITADKLK
jgi:ribose transport system substrate-binding protein